MPYHYCREHIYIALTVKTHAERKAARFPQMFDVVDFCLILLFLLLLIDAMPLILGTFPLVY